MTEPAALAARFPAHFQFGAATASYQIEGAVEAEGRGPSIWDRFSAEPGRVVNGDTGAIACDHYHRWQSDLDLLQHYHVDAYRFSIAWPRVIPTGRGPVNEKGLDWYDRLIDGLVAREIKVFPTLYHWDLPDVLQQRGGWTHRDTAEAFAEYAHAVVARIGDRVDAIATFNEPFCFCYLGYLMGVHAPGIKDLTAAVRAVHIANLGHGLGVQAIRAARSDVPVGTVINAMAIMPASDADGDRAAAERHFQMFNGAFMTPVFQGGYDDEFHAAFEDELDIRTGDVETIKQPLDWWGLNYYAPSAVAAADTAEQSPFPHTVERPATTSGIRTDIGWEIEPAALTRLLIQLNERYALPPCYITENGACYNDGPDARGVINDQARIDYLRTHIAAVADAMESGADVRGYFAWSLMDNFEWAEGYTMRFGLTHVDYATQVRTIKQSGHWYRALIEAHLVERSQAPTP